MIKTIQLFSLVLLAAVSSPSNAQTYPNRMIRAVIGYAPGGVTDVIARLAADEMSKHFGQPVVVENRPGASGLVAATAVRNASPDGYTLFIGPTTGFAPVFMKDNFLVASKELAPISNLVHGDWFLYAAASIGASSLKDLAAYAKANPGKIRFASAATSNSMLMALVAKRLGFVIEDIPYKTTDQTIAALLAGDSQITFNAASGFGPHVQAGKIRAIATLSPQRTDLLPDVATAGEQGVPLSVRFSTGLWAPLSTPRVAIAALNRAASEALKDPQTVRRVKSASLTPAPSTPEALVADLESQLRIYAEAAEVAGYKPR